MKRVDRFVLTETCLIRYTAPWVFLHPRHWPRSIWRLCK